MFLPGPGDHMTRPIIVFKEWHVDYLYFRPRNTVQYPLHTAFILSDTAAVLKLNLSFWIAERNDHYAHDLCESMCKKAIKARLGVCVSGVSVRDVRLKTAKMA